MRVEGHISGFSRRTTERRQSERLRVLVPATVECGNKRYTAKVLNIVPTGAMIETSAPLAPRCRLRLCCGTLSEMAVVVWRDEQRAGVKFLWPLTDAHVREQVSRTEAVRTRLRRDE